jgi:hypothetical protein
VAFLAVLAMASAAPAQEAEERGAPRVQKINDVERGFWIRSAFGFSTALGNVFETEGSETPIWPPAPLLGVELGYDLGQVASLHLAFYGQAVSGTQSTAGADVSNDVGALLAMVGARFNIITTKRLAWLLKANVGYMMAVPSLDSVDDGLAIHGATGLEYATNLRHFSVGLEVGAGFMMASSALSIILTPTLKYVF